MRFAWLQKQTDDDISSNASALNRIILTIYNLVWWLPILLTLTETIDPRTGMVSFAVITLIRAVANWYRINVLPLDEAINFPLRTP